MQLLRRFTVGNGRTSFYFLAELYLLFKMDWGLRWEFLVSFCVALCFSVSRNSVSLACTAILRLVHDSDSGRVSACTNFWIFFRFCRFSPFAEEGFTCLDHSMMSKKAGCWGRLLFEVMELQWPRLGMGFYLLFTDWVMDWVWGFFWKVSKVTSMLFAWPGFRFLSVVFALLCCLVVFGGL